MHLTLSWDLAWGIAVGVAGAVGVEAFYRFAKRRALVFDRL
jgi:cation-transporting ATPase E